MAGKPPPEKQCTGTSKRTGGRCEGWALKGKDVCYHHGGASPSGAGSATFKHGRYSTLLPKGLKDRYEETLNDDHYAELRDEVALVDSRIGDVLSRMDLGESGEGWLRLMKLWRQFEEVSEAKDTTTAGRILRMIGSVIEGGVEEYAAWASVSKLVNQRRQLAESERKRMVEEHQMISTGELLVLVSQLTDIIMRHVPDRKARGAINSEIGTLISAGAQGDAEKTHLN